MRQTIPLRLADPPASAPSIEIDAAQVAEGLGLGVEEFRRLMDARKISVLCERGTGEDAGLHRATFYHRERRLRLVVDQDGTVVDRETSAAGGAGEAGPGGEPSRPPKGPTAHHRADSNARGAR